MSDLSARLAEFADANEKYALARLDTETLEFKRPIFKEDAISRLQIPAKEGEKALSYTAAERLVETDRQYFDFCAEIRKARKEEQLRWGQMIAAQYRAKAASQETP